MSLLAALTPDTERTLPPASGLPWRAEFLKFPGRYEPGAGAPDGRCADTAALAGRGRGWGGGSALLPWEDWCRSPARLGPCDRSTAGGRDRVSRSPAGRGGEGSPGARKSP